MTVLYTTFDDTASSPGDYSSAGGQLTFPPGVTSQSFNIGIIDDMDIEGPETIQLELGSPINANLGTLDQASLTINDDDRPGVQFSSSSYSATEASGSATVTVTLTSTAPFVVTVEYATSDGTAAAGSDYMTASGTLTFNPNVTAQTFSVPVLRDAVIETDETVNLALGNPDKANLGSPLTATLTIVDSTLRQITLTTGCPSNLAPASNADGTRLIFRSNCDPLGANADGSFEIFLFDTAGSLTQTTTSVSCDNTFATINDNGTRIAFDSTCDPFGTNIDANLELMLLEPSTGTLTQSTITMGCLNQETSINAIGTRIAFRSDCDPLGSNGDLNDEIFLFEPSTNSLSQLTATNGCLNAEPSMSADGTRIAFSSDCDPLGGNGDFNLEIFLFDTSTNTLSALTTTLGCQNLAPSISDDGTHVALRTSCDSAGSNPDGNFEIGLVDVASIILTQLTITTGCNNFAPASNVDGSRIAFYANCDSLGSNGDNNFELFLSDAGTLRQIFQTVGCGNQDPAIDNTGTRITYISDCDLLGTNGDGNFEIFQAILN